MNTLSFILALLVLVLTVVAFFISRIDAITGVLIGGLAVAVISLTWVPVIANRRVV